MAIVGIFNIHIIVGIVNILDSNFQVSDIVNQIISKYYNLKFHKINKKIILISAANL